MGFNETKLLNSVENYRHGSKEKANMKAHRFSLLLAGFLSAALALLSGCKYNVSTPLWDQPYKAPGTPQITSVVPAGEAKPGLEGNLITIYGHNFIIPSSDTLTPDSTIVYFNTLQANIVSVDSNKIVARRPNLPVDTCTIKVSVHNAIVEPTIGPYKIDQVLGQYGTPWQNTVQLGGIAVNGSEYLYVMENTTNKYIHKVAPPDGENITLTGGVTQGAPWGACIGPDNSVYIMSGTTRWIAKVVPVLSTAATDSVQPKWVQLPKLARFGDCDHGGYLFTGGYKTDLYIVPLYASGTLSASQYSVAGSYAADSIFAVTVYNGYLYVASKSSTSPSGAKIWRHQLTSDSTLGSQELVLDMGSTAFANDPISGIAFSSAGDMYIATNSTDALLVDPGAGSDGTMVDYFYKGIVPQYISGIAYSKTSNYLYAITGNSNTNQAWTVYRIDMGMTGGASF